MQLRETQRYKGKYAPQLAPRTVPPRSQTSSHSSSSSSASAAWTWAACTGALPGGAATSFHSSSSCPCSACKHSEAQPHVKSRRATRVLLKIKFVQSITFAFSGLCWPFCTDFLSPYTSALPPNPARLPFYMASFPFLPPPSTVTRPSTISRQNYPCPCRENLGP